MPRRKRKPSLLEFLLARRAAARLGSGYRTEGTANVIHVRVDTGELYNAITPKLQVLDGVRMDHKSLALAVALGIEVWLDKVLDEYEALSK